MINCTVPDDAAEVESNLLDICDEIDVDTGRWPTDAAPFVALALAPADRREGATYAEIAAALGCSRERVRQIEKAALKKLRRAFVRLFRDEPALVDMVRRDRKRPWVAPLWVPLDESAALPVARKRCA